MREGPSVWQISGGPASRPYGDIFLRHGVALIGPADTGPWSLERDGWIQEASVRRFSQTVQVGDAILLRTGISTVRAVGLVASEYLYLTVFDDVNGWDLQHARRVRWSELPSVYDFGAPVFGSNPARISRVWNEVALDYVYRFLNSPPTHWQQASLPPLPEEEPPLDDVPQPLISVVSEARDLYPILSDHRAFGEQPTEDELVAHFVIPLVRSLGWPPERIGVKWRRVDVALFKDLPRVPENCHIVIEAKRPNAGVEGALDQAMGYLQELGVQRDVVVTDGMCYRMYSCSDDFSPVAYANLARLKRSASELFSRLKRP